MVGMLDALSLKNTRLGMETLELMGYDPRPGPAVLNRANTSVGITRNDVVSILGRVPDVLVPSHRDIARSVNEGAPVVISQRRSEAARAFESLAGLFSRCPYRRRCAQGADPDAQGQDLARPPGCTGNHEPVRSHIDGTP